MVLFAEEEADPPVPGLRSLQLPADLEAGGDENVTPPVAAFGGQNPVRVAVDNIKLKRAGLVFDVHFTVAFCFLPLFFGEVYVASFSATMRSGSSDVLSRPDFRLTLFGGFLLCQSMA